MRFFAFMGKWDAFFVVKEEEKNETVVTFSHDDVFRYAHVRFNPVLARVAIYRQNFVSVFTLLGFDTSPFLTSFEN